MAEKVFILSSKADFSSKLKALLPSFLYTSVTCFQTIQTLKTNLRTQSCDLVIIQEPLKDGVAWKVAREICAISDVEVLLLVSGKQYDQIAYQLQETGIFVLAFPIKAQVLLQSLELLRMKRGESKKFQHEISKLKKTIHDDRIINRAKMLLIESYHWTENKAHHYIEHASMENSISKVEVAKQLIERYNS